MLLEAQAGELVEADLGDGAADSGEYGAMLGNPLVGGEDVLGAETCSKQIAYYLMCLGNEEVLGLAELFLFQLAYKFYLIFTYHYLKCYNSVTKIQKIRYGYADYTEFF